MEHKKIMHYSSLFCYVIGTVMLMMSLFGKWNTWEIRTAAILAVMMGISLEMYLIRERLELIE
jgi:hypothetical protein